MGKNKKQLTYKEREPEMLKDLKRFTDKYNCEFIAGIRFQMPLRSQVFNKLFGKIFPFKVEKQVLIQPKSTSTKVVDAKVRGQK